MFALQRTTDKKIKHKWNNIIMTQHKNVFSIEQKTVYTVWADHFKTANSTITITLNII